MPKIDDYELLEKIGTGSYSDVHRAKHKVFVENGISFIITKLFSLFAIYNPIFKETKQLFAIKCIAKANLSKTSTDNCLREIRLLKTLKHKHIVEMIDFRWDEKYKLIFLFCSSI